MLRFKFLTASLALAGLLTACGGGGGGTSSSTALPNPASSTTIALNGTAAKGLMAKADVTVHAVDASGNIEAAVLASTKTGDDGTYGLSFTGVAGKPYIIKVTANAETTHLDEVSGASQALPVGFTMRSVIVPQTSGTITARASVTPFSEMAVAAAMKVEGGITAASVAQASSTLQQLFGFDVVSVDANTIAGADTTQERQLAVLLYAVSQLAADGSLGCTTGTAGEKVLCVVNTLASAASTGSTSLTSGTVDVSAQLLAAVNTVLATPQVAAVVDEAILAPIVNNLGCTSNCQAAPVATGTPIESAKALFAQLKTDLTSMFSRGGATSIATGAVNQEAFKFNTVMSAAQLPAEVLAKDIAALQMGTKLYADYKAGFVVSPTRSISLAADTDGTFYVPAVSCGLYQDSTYTALATDPSNANSVGCSARYFVTRQYSGSGYVQTEARHGFGLTPVSPASFSYSSAARVRQLSCDTTGKCTVTANTLVQTAPASKGDLTVGLDTSGNRTFAVAGELPPAFVSGGMTLVNYNHTVNVSGTQIAGAASATTNLSGNIKAMSDATTTASTLTVKSGTLSLATLADGSQEPTGFALNVLWNANTAEFEGLLSASDVVADASGLVRAPTKMTLGGMLRNIENGVTTEFLKGTLTASTTGFASFNATQPSSSTNKFNANLEFAGTFTAPQRPVLDFTVAGAFAVDGANTPLGLTAQYRTLVDGKPRTVVSLVGTPATATQPASFQLTEATANLGLSWRKGDATASLVAGSLAERIGTYDMNTHLLTFTDNSFISLDFGI